MRRFAMPLLILVAVLAAPLTAQELPETDLKAIWPELTPEERAQYEALMAARDARSEPGPSPATDGPVQGDLCTLPDAAVVVLPYMDSGDTTSAANDYDLDNTGANGDCGSGQFTFTGTGAANEVTYSIETDVDCTLQIDAAPTGGQDLALYVVEDSCNPLPGFVNGECIALDDNGGGGTAEGVQINAVAGSIYYVIVDGFNAAGVGTYDLDISEVGATGCNLIPVELQTFGVD
ncbi:MAG: hypothetical protein AAF560_12285 [Acidobacteriota bacterium]